MRHKSRKPVTCQCCRSKEAVYAYQEVEEGRPSFTLFGAHYRGFQIIAYVCGNCAEKIRTGVIDIARA